MACLPSCRSGGGAAGDSAASHSRHAVSHAALGTAFRLTVYAPTADQGRDAIAAALRRLDEVDAALNAARPDSAISALNAAGEGVAVRLGDDLFAVLQQARRLSAATRGAFDVTAGPYRELWLRAAADGRAPSAAELEAAKLRVGWDKLSLNPIERSATLTAPGMRLDASGIARGYAADQIFRRLRAQGCERSKVDAGTVVVVGEPPRGREGWPIAVYGTDTAGGKPRTLSLTRRAIGFSPNTPLPRRSGPAARRGVPQLIDPVGGRSSDDRPAAAVLATSGTAAESVAYAAAVLGPDGADVAAAEGAAKVRFNPAGQRQASRQASGQGRR